MSFPQLERILFLEFLFIFSNNDTIFKSIPKLTNLRLFFNINWQFCDPLDKTVKIKDNLECQPKIIELLYSFKKIIPVLIFRSVQ